MALDPFDADPSQNPFINGDEASTNIFGTLPTGGLDLSSIKPRQPLPPPKFDYAPVQQPVQQPAAPAQVFVNPQTKEIIAGGKVLPFDWENGTLLDNYEKAGFFNKRVNPNYKPPEGFQTYNSDQFVAMRDKMAQGRSFGNTAGEVAKQAGVGLTSDLPAMINEAGSWGAQQLGADSAKEFFDSNAGYWREKGEGANAKDLLGRGVVGESLVEGARSLAPSVAAVGAFAASPAAGLAATFGVFGGSQARTTYDNVINAGGTPDDALKAAWSNFFIEGGGEAIGDYVGAKFITAGAKALQGLVRGGKVPLAEAVRIATNPQTLADFGKAWVANTAVQTSTEFGQNYAESAVEQHYGVPNSDPWESGIQGLKAAAGMSVLMAPLGAPAHVRENSRRAALGEALNNPASPLDLLQASTAVQPEIESLAGKDEAARWMDGQQNTAWGQLKQQVVNNDHAQALQDRADFMKNFQPSTLPTPSPESINSLVGVGQKTGIKEAELKAAFPPISDKIDPTIVLDANGVPYSTTSRKEFEEFQANGVTSKNAPKPAQGEAAGQTTVPTEPVEIPELDGAGRVTHDVIAALAKANGIRMQNVNQTWLDQNLNGRTPQEIVDELGPMGDLRAAYKNKLVEAIINQYGVGFVDPTEPPARPDPATITPEIAFQFADQMGEYVKAGVPETNWAIFTLVNGKRQELDDGTTDVAGASYAAAAEELNGIGLDGIEWTKDKVAGRYKTAVRSITKAAEKAGYTFDDARVFLNMDPNVAVPEATVSVAAAAQDGLTYRKGSVMGAAPDNFDYEDTYGYEQPEEPQGEEPTQEQPEGEEPAPVQEDSENPPAREEEEEATDENSYETEDVIAANEGNRDQDYEIQALKDQFASVYDAAGLEYDDSLEAGEPGFDQLGAAQQRRWINAYIAMKGGGLTGSTLDAIQARLADDFNKNGAYTRSAKINEWLKSISKMFNTKQFGYINVKPEQITLVDLTKHKEALMAVKRMSNLGYDLGNAHVSSFWVIDHPSKAFDALVSKSGGKYYIVVNKNLLDGLRSPHKEAESITRKIMHEVFHAVDDSQGERVYSSNPVWSMSGEIWKELHPKFRAGNPWVRAWFGYPMDAGFRGDEGLSPVGVQKEMFAQVMSAYHEDPMGLQAHAPETYKAARKIYEIATGKLARQDGARDTGAESQDQVGGTGNTGRSNTARQHQLGERDSATSPEAQIEDFLVFRAANGLVDRGVDAPEPRMSATAQALRQKAGITKGAVNTIIDLFYDRLKQTGPDTAATVFNWLKSEAAIKLALPVESHGFEITAPEKVSDNQIRHPAFLHDVTSNPVNAGDFVSWMVDGERRTAKITKIEDQLEGGLVTLSQPIDGNPSKMVVFSIDPFRGVEKPNAYNLLDKSDNELRLWSTPFLSIVQANSVVSRKRREAARDVENLLRKEKQKNASFFVDWNDYLTEKQLSLLEYEYGIVFYNHDAGRYEINRVSSAISGVKNELIAIAENIEQTGAAWRTSDEKAAYDAVTKILINEKFNFAPSEADVLEQEAEQFLFKYALSKYYLDAGRARENTPYTEALPLAGKSISAEFYAEFKTALKEGLSPKRALEQAYAALNTRDNTIRKYLGDSRTGWIRFEGGDKVKEMHDVASSNDHWCIGYGISYAERYLNSGDTFYIYVKNGDAIVSARVSRGALAEWSGAIGRKSNKITKETGGNQRVPKEHEYLLDELLKQHPEIDTSGRWVGKDEYYDHKEAVDTADITTKVNKLIGDVYTGVSVKDQVEDLIASDDTAAIFLLNSNVNTFNKRVANGDLKATSEEESRVQELEEFAAQASQLASSLSAASESRKKILVTLEEAIFADTKSEMAKFTIERTKAIETHSIAKEQADRLIDEAQQAIYSALGRDDAVSRLAAVQAGHTIVDVATKVNTSGRYSDILDLYEVYGLTAKEHLARMKRSIDLSPNNESAIKANAKRFAIAYFVESDVVKAQQIQPYAVFYAGNDLGPQTHTMNLYMAERSRRWEFATRVKDSLVAILGLPHDAINRAYDETEALRTHLDSRDTTDEVVSAMVANVKSDLLSAVKESDKIIAEKRAAINTAANEFASNLNNPIKLKENYVSVANEFTAEQRREAAQEMLDQVFTKLDLVDAYRDMGDEEGAYVLGIEVRTYLMTKAVRNGPLQVEAKRMHDLLIVGRRIPQYLQDAVHDILANAKLELGLAGRLPNPPGELNFDGLEVAGDAENAGPDFSRSYTPGSEMPSKMRDWLSDLGTNMTSGVKNVFPDLLNNFQLWEQYKDSAVGDTLKEHFRLSDMMSTLQQKLVRASHDILKDWSAVPDADALGTVMRDATTWGMHPDQAFDSKGNDHLSADGKDATRYAELSKRYNALSKEAKDVYKKSKKLLAENWSLRKQIVAEVYTAAYGKMIKEAKKRGDDDRIARLEKRRDKAIKEHESLVNMIKGPYFPLMRFGDYLVIAESKKLHDVRAKLEEALDGAEINDQSIKKMKDLIKQLEEDENHYVVEAHDTEAAQRRSMQSLEGKGYVVRLRMGHDIDRNNRTIGAGEIDKAFDLIDENSPSSAEANKLKELMVEAYFASMPENHALQRQIRRKGTAGASADMLRAFAEAVERDSFYLSRLKHGKDISSNLYKMDREAAKSTEGGRVYNAILRRTNLDYTYANGWVGRWAAGAARWSSLYHLGWSPAYLLTNMSQPWTVTAPFLAGTYGAFKSIRALSRAWGDASKIMSKGRGKFFSLKNIDLDSKDLNLAQGEREMLKRLIDMGKLDIGQNVDMATFANGGTPTMRKLWDVYNFVNHNIELSNRITTALAAYRLADGKGNFEHGLEMARQAVELTQLSYDDASAAYVMKNAHLGGLNRIPMQFRKYQQGMLYLLYRNGKAWFKGDKEAGRAFLYLMATQFMVAGARGVPVVAAPLALLNMIVGDDDDEKGNLETRLRNYTAEAIGPKAARVFWKGAPAMWGMDSTSLGMGNLLSPTPFMRVSDVTNARTGEEGIKELMFNLAGAPVALSSRILDAYILAKQEEYSKAASKALPRVAAAPVRAYNLGTEGLTKRNGMTVMGDEKFDIWDIGMTAAGFQNTKVSEHYEAQTVKHDVTTAIEARRKKIFNMYAKVRLEGGNPNEVMEEVRKFNEDHPTMRITQGALLKSLQQQRRIQRNTDETGVEFTRREKSLQGLTTFAK